jgi:hypothetical protein
VLAQELDADQVLVVSETEYTGAGKSPVAQLEFARAMGVEVTTGDPAGDRPGERIVIPTEPEQLRCTEVDLDRMRTSYLRRALADSHAPLADADVEFLAADCRADPDLIRAGVAEAVA